MKSEDYIEIARLAMEEEARLSIAKADGYSEVYFLQESGMGAIKIGITCNLERRLSQMRSNTPHEITVLGTVHADEKLERYLKRKFSFALIRGEWFRPNEELSAYIEETTGYEIALRRLIDDDDEVA